MAGGCSTQKSIAINDAGAKVASDQLTGESKDENGNQNALANKKNKKLSKKEQKELDKLMKKQLTDDDLCESVEDLNQFGKPGAIKSEKEYQDIWNAIHVNDTDKLEKLLKNKEWPNSALFDKEKNHTMLHTAAALGHVEALMTIIEHTDAKPDLLNSNLATPLHFA
jgi:hypothetical protein